MEFTLIRIDDRLIHGQVALGWSRSKGINCILAVDDATAANALQCSLLKLATPPGVVSYIVGEKKAKELIDSGKLEKKRVMLLVKGVDTLSHLKASGVEIKEVNVGNLRTKGGRKLLEIVHCSDHEIASFQALISQGVTFYAQSLPDQPITDFNQVVKGAVGSDDV